MLISTLTNTRVHTKQIYTNRYIVRTSNPKLIVFAFALNYRTPANYPRNVHARARRKIIQSTKSEGASGKFLSSLHAPTLFSRDAVADRDSAGNGFQLLGSRVEWNDTGALEKKKIKTKILAGSIRFVKRRQSRLLPYARCTLVYRWTVFQDSARDVLFDRATNKCKEIERVGHCCASRTNLFSMVPKCRITFLR